MMQSFVQKWGNSLAIRIPKALARTVHLDTGSDVNMSVQDGKIIIEPRPVLKYSLDALLEGVTRKNLHHEIDTGAPVGKEVW